MKNLSPEQLKALYGNFIVYRDIFCDGKANMSVRDFYNKHGLSKYTHEPSKS